MPASFGLKNEYRTYYIVFQESQFNRIWRAWTCPGFRHIWTFWPLYVGEPGLLTPRWTLKFEPLANHFDIDLWYADPDEVAASFLQKPEITDILKIQLLFRTGSEFVPRGVMNCVSSVKACIGVRAWHIITPKQLYNFLIHEGAKSLRRI